jgi:hypothetical protein
MKNTSTIFEIYQQLSVLLHHEFPHLYDEEEDKILEDSHDVTAVICAQFNGEGDCYAFDILKLQPVL